MPKDEMTEDIQGRKPNDEKYIKPREQDFDKTYILRKSKEDTSPVGVSPMVKMTDEKWMEIEREIGGLIEIVLRDNSAFIDKLVEYQEAIDGIPERGRKPPWANACKLRDTLTSTHCRIIENAITRTKASEPYYIAKVKGDPEKALLLQGLMNDSCKEDFNFEVVVGEIAKSATRKTVGIMVPEWERKVKIEKDVLYFKTVEAYKEFFTDAKDAGLTEQQYQYDIEVVKADIEKYGIHECIYEFDSVVINRPTVKTVKPEDFIMYPYTSPTIELAKLLGYKMGKTYNDLIMMERDGIYKAIKLIMGKDNTSEAVEGINVVLEAQLENKNIDAGTETTSYKNKIFTLYKGIYSKDVDDSGLERDYEYVYLYEHKSNMRIMLRFAYYDINYNERNFLPVNILPEDGTIFGTCIPELLQNPQATLDVLIRLLVDSNSIANVPMFVGHETDQETIRRSRDKGKIFPGRFFWLKQASVFSALKGDRIDANSFLAIIRYIAHMAETASGASQTLAGQNLPDDPTAPGVKTAMLIQRADMFVNSYIVNMRPSFGKLAKFIIKLYRQHMKHGEIRSINVLNSENKIVKKDINRDDIQFLDEITTFELKNQKVEDNQQTRQMMALRDTEVLLAVPQIAENPMAVRALMIMYLTATGRYTVEEINKIAPTQEQVQQMFKSVAQDVLAAERAGQQKEALGNQNQQITDQTEKDIQGQIEAQ